MDLKQKNIVLKIKMLKKAFRSYYWLKAFGKNQYSIVECKHYNDFIKVDVGFQLNLNNKKDEFSNFLKKTRKNKHHIDIIVFSILGIENKHKANLNSNIIDINLKEELDLN